MSLPFNNVLATGKSAHCGWIPQFGVGMGAGRKCMVAKKSKNWGTCSVGGLACCQIVIYHSNLVSTFFIYVAGKDTS
jgi:hypothetical protein